MTIIRKVAIFFVGLVAYGLMNAALTVEIRDINTASVNVPDQSPTDFQKALPQAFGEVLVRMSGNTAIMTLPTIQNSLSKLSNYVEKYSYTTKTDDVGKSQLMLQVVFDKRALAQLLRDANQAIWGEANRPLTMVWVSVPAGMSREILVSNSQSSAIQAIKETASSRGVPIIFPAMDLEDQTDAAQSTATLLSRQQLHAILQRYGIDCILAGAVVKGGSGELQGEWQLFLNGTPYEWQTTGNDIMQVVMNGVDRAADMMASQFSLLNSKNMENFVLMQVRGVQNLEDYVHVISTLKHLRPVVKVSVSDMTNDMLLLKITIAGSLEDLVNALKCVSHLAVETAPPSARLNAANLFYRWETNPASAEGAH